MALTFQQLNDTALDPAVRGRIRVAATRVAMAVAAEATTGTGGDVRWSKRNKLAQSVIQQAKDTTGQDLLDRFVWAVIGVINVTGTAPTDAELQQYITDSWDRIAGVTAAES